MIVTIVFRNGSELSLKAKEVECTHNGFGALTNVSIKGMKGKRLIYFTVEDILYITADDSDEKELTDSGTRSNDCAAQTDADRN